MSFQRFTHRLSRSRPDVYPGFPAAPVIRREWNLENIRLRPSRAGHGAQLFIEAAGSQAGWVLKRCRDERHRPEDLERMLALLNTLGARQAPRNLPVVRPRAQGSLLLREGHAVYYLMERVSGRRASFRKPADVERIVTALGRLHHDGRLLAGESERSLPAVDAQAIYEDGTYKVDRLTQRLGHPRPGVEGLLIQSYGRLHHRMVEYARLADAFMHDNMARLPEEQRVLHPVLSHGDTHENNYLMDPAGGPWPWMLDLESCCWRPGVIDLVVPLHYHGFYRGWHFAEIERLLAAYESQRPLPAAEKVLLGAMLIYPRHWARALWQLLKPGAWSSWGTQRYLLNCVMHLGVKRRFIEGLIHHWRVEAATDDKVPRNPASLYEGPPAS